MERFSGGGELLNVKCVLILFTNFSEIFLILRRGRKI